MVKFVKPLNWKRVNKRILSFILAGTIIISTVPQLLVEVWNGLTSLFVSATGETTYTAPECEFLDELYDGSDAIKPLPSYNEYKTQTGYTEPKLYSLTDFRALCGEGLLFNSNAANSYITQGYKIMILDAAELYLLSQIVNGSGSPDEMTFYLSANYVLGNNIEYSEMSYEEKYFKPIGNHDRPFVGTFDGQCFEIRDLYFDTTYTKATIALFGVVGAGGTVGNFGLYHPTFNASNNNSTYAAGIASENYGTIDSVYVIVQEYTVDGTVTLNAITSANAVAAGGLVAYNHTGGVLSNSYFAGMLNAHDPEKQNPVCAVNDGTVTNCYYDKDIFPYGETGSQIDTVEGEITGLSNIDLKKVGISANGMQNTKFKVRRSAINSNNTIITDTNTTQKYWGYPRLYGYTGTGTESYPFLISTPADLINFPNSAEYSSGTWSTQYYFALANCIDMNTVAPNAYKPKLDVTIYNNYLENGVWLQYTYSSIDRSFKGVFTGIAKHGEENCPIHHVTDLGNDYEGNLLQESHIILNLTIDTPATTGTNYDKAYSAFIAQANYTYYGTSGAKYSRIENLQFVGGYISSGSGDYLPSTYKSDKWNIRSATVVAAPDYTDLTNVHSSATVTTGMGKQYSIMLGGLAGYGTVRRIMDCTNSGNIIGGYVDMVGESYASANARVSGIGHIHIGSTTNTLDWRFLGKMTHVANYGTVSAVVFVTDSSNSWQLTSGSSRAAGISTGYLASYAMGNVTNKIGTADTYTVVNDETRSDRIANFGIISDTPVEFDENGDVIFEAENKPKAVALESSKRVVENTSPLYMSYLFGIGYSSIAHAYNAGNLYSLALNKTVAAGIGYMENSASSAESKVGGYVNYANYNHGNLYFWNGSGGGYGIGIYIAFMCYNDGSINVYGGEITAYFANNGITPKANAPTGSFSGIAGYSAFGCYNNGTLYIAPSARNMYNNQTTSDLKIRIAGNSPWIGSYCLYNNSDENTIMVKNINNGKITLDLETYHFNPETNTDGAYAPDFRLNGTGYGGCNDNYGIFDFVPYKEKYSKYVSLLITGCGTWVNANPSRSFYDSNNYMDISVDTTEAQDCLGGQVYLCGLAQNSGSVLKAYDCVNYGNITFSGKINCSLNLIPFYLYLNRAERCINLGDITITPDSVVTGTTNIYTFYSNTASTSSFDRFSDLMNGWYDGCSIPSGFMEDTYKERYQTLFDSLDKNKRYGKVTVSGTFNGLVTVKVLNYYSSAQVDYAYRIFNNGTYTVRDAIFKNGQWYFGLSNMPLSYSENHALIEASHFAAIGSPANNINFYGTAGGEYNINYTDIYVHDFATRTTSNARYVIVSGSYAVNGIKSNHIENRGNLIVKNGRETTVNGVEYKSPLFTGESSSLYDSIISVSGIGYNADISYSINFGNIIVDNVFRYQIGGVTYSNSLYTNKTFTFSNCLNYGNITVTNSGGLAYVGGVVAYNSAGTIEDCANFGEITIKNEQSYKSYDEPGASIGGVCGYQSGGNIYACANYAKVNYINEQGINTDNVYTNTRLVKDYFRFGGVIGYKTSGNMGYCMNYADISVKGEENVMMMVGGIFGRANGTCGYSCINYGDIIAPAANPTTKNESYIAGLAGYISGTNSTSGLKYMINYGSINLIGEKTTSTYVGALITRKTDNTAYYVNFCVDLSTPPENLDSYPMFNGAQYNKPNTDNAVNYTINEQTVTDTEGVSYASHFGTVKHITLDNDNMTGLFAPTFPFRSMLLTGIASNIYPIDTIFKNTEVALNQDNGLVYQDYDQLSPYLQAYMVEHFGEEIKNYGAYVVMERKMDYIIDFYDENYRRAYDEYFPQSLIDSAYNYDIIIEGKSKDEVDDPSDNTFGCVKGNYTDSSIVSDTELSSLYSSVVAPENRTVKSDLEYYAMQVQNSSLAEIYDVNFQTSYEYNNNDTSFYQNFNEYQYLIQDYPAYSAKNGKFSDNVIYTDVNIYIAVDDINSYDARYIVYDDKGEILKDENDDTVYAYINPNGTIRFHANIDVGSYYSSMVFYKGDTVETSKRLEEMDWYIDEYPNGKDYYSNMWLNCDNVDEMLADGSLWTPSINMQFLMSHSRYDSNGDGKINGLDDFYWEMDIPFTNDNCINNMYTKVIGVATAEDGIHQNIVVAHVVIDKYKPYATLNSVTLQTPSDGTVTSTVENGRLNGVENQPSLTDYDRQNPDQNLNDVTYYYMVNAEGMNGENIEKWNYSTTSSNWPTITLDTHNMDEDDSIKVVVTRQEQTPLDGVYNNMVWNDYLDTDEAKSAVGISRDTFIINPQDIEYDEQQKSVGKAVLNIDSMVSAGENNQADIGIMYYGGLYRVDLYYERTKDSGTYKHFATVFIAKEYSPHNTALHSVSWLWYLQTANPRPAYSNQIAYDAIYTEGGQTGYASFLANRYGYYTNSNYTSVPIAYWNFSHASNATQGYPNLSSGNGSWYALKAYMSTTREQSFFLGKDNAAYNYLIEEYLEAKAERDAIVAEGGESYEVTMADRGVEKTLEYQVHSIFVYQDEKTGAYYPTLFQSSMDIMAENGDIRTYTTEFVQTGIYGETDERTYNNDPKITVSSATKNGYPIIKNEDDKYEGAILGYETDDVTFTVSWTSSNVLLYHTNNQPASIKGQAIYAGDGYNVNKLRIYYTPINSDESVELTSEQIETYFTSITCATNGVWTIQFKNTAPVGKYEVMPYITYHMNFSTNTNQIQLYDAATETLIGDAENNIIEFTISYSESFVINNIPNDDSYMTELDVSNDQYTPYILETVEHSGSDDRDVYIRTATENQEIVYVGYDDYKTGDDRIDAFTVYSYTGKTEQESDIRFRVPYRATLQKWTGTGAPDEDPDGTWIAVTLISEYDDEGNEIDSDYKQYTDHLSYNEKNEFGEYTYNSSITYYRVVAEDEKTMTTYKVYVVPGVRNKTTTLEVAQTVEEFGGSDEFKSKMEQTFAESDAIYQEILENYGMITATIKELNGTIVDVYQTKMFTELSTIKGETEPYIYNLKSFAYDISVDLPAGYTYDVLVFSQDMDNAQQLKNSTNGFSGKQLILSSSDDQIVNIRLVLKRDTSSQIWGVQYLWNFTKAACDENGHILNTYKGGVYNNYVYTRTA